MSQSSSSSGRNPGISLGDGCDPATGAWARFSTDKTYVSDFAGSVGVNYIARGLTAEETYRFQVRQVNEAGTGGPVSDTVGAIAGSGNKAAGPVKNLSATPGNGQVKLSWDRIENQGRPITAWLYRYCEGPECVLSPNLWYTIWNSDEATTEHTVTGLRNGTTYRFQVVPWNESESEYSDTVIVTLP